MEHPDIPLDNNAAERDIRVYITKRKTKGIVIMNLLRTSGLALLLIIVGLMFSAAHCDEVDNGGWGWKLATSTDDLMNFLYLGTWLTLCTYLCYTAGKFFE
jgi:hypothetical protein